MAFLEDSLPYYLLRNNSMVSVGINLSSRPRLFSEVIVSAYIHTGGILPRRARVIVGRLELAIVCTSAGIVDICMQCPVMHLRHADIVPVLSRAPHRVNQSVISSHIRGL